MKQELRVLAGGACACGRGVDARWHGHGCPGGEDLPLVSSWSGALVGWHTDPPPLLDVLVQLGRIPRFAGATTREFSVLQHSLHVWKLATMQNPGVALAALLHDAAEILTGDIPTPFKPDDFGALEREWVEHAAGCWGITENWGAVWPSVKQLDAQALRIEGKFLTAHGGWRTTESPHALEWVLHMQHGGADGETLALAARILRGAGGRI